MKMIKGLENLSYEERQKELDLFFLGNRRLRENFIIVFQYVKGSYKERGFLFKRIHVEQRRGNSCRLHWVRFHLDVRTTFLTVRTSH